MEVSSNVLDFKDTVKKFDNRSRIWLGAIIGLAALLGLAICLLIYWQWFDKQIFDDYKTAASSFNVTNNYFNVILYFEIIKKSLIRVLIISMLIYFLKFAINNYNTCMHNSTINQHKANILDAALRMLTLTKEGDAAFNRVMDLAALEIFSHHNTGYLRSEEKIDGSIVEKVLALMKKKE